VEDIGTRDEGFRSATKEGKDKTLGGNQKKNQTKKKKNKPKYCSGELQKRGKQGANWGPVLRVGGVHFC